MTGQEFLKAFVCGWPIEHSRSPLIHNYWLKRFGIQGEYKKIAIKPEDFSEFIGSLKNRGFIGGNVTIPHKEAALELADQLDDAARRIGAVNTLWFEGNKLIGGNTDWVGFASNLDQFAAGWDSEKNEGRPALILGAGGASRGVIYALQQRGFSKITIANRTLEKAKQIAREFGSGIEAISLDAVQHFDQKPILVVNTTSLGMKGHSPIPEFMQSFIEGLDPSTIVTDIVYVPLKTGFLKLAENAGLQTVDGLGMLLHQAAPGFERWFGQNVEVTEELRQLIISDMENSA